MRGVLSKNPICMRLDLTGLVQSTIHDQQSKISGAHVTPFETGFQPALHINIFNMLRLYNFACTTYSST